MIIEDNIVGSAIQIDGLKVIVRMKENTNMLVYYRNGEKFRGVSVGQYIGIIRGPYKLIGRVEKEYLEDIFKEYSFHSYEENRFKREIEIKLVGFFLRERN